MADFTSRIVWHQLFTEDLAKAKGFYGALFGWRYRTMRSPDFEYVIVRQGNVEFAGMARLADEPLADRSYWAPLCSSEDTDEDADRVDATGGGVAIPPVDIPDVGRLALLEDPDDLPFMLLSEELPGQATRHNQPGLFYWDELATPDPKGAVKFYGRLCNWVVSSHDIGKRGTYFIFRDREAKQKDVAGMHGVPAGGAGGWRGYISVNSVNQAVRITEELDGETETEPTRIPGIGRFAHLIDNQGARFAVIEVGERGKF